MKNRTVLPRDSSTPLRFAQNDVVVFSSSACFALKDSEEAEEEDYKISMQSP